MCVLSNLLQIEISYSLLWSAGLDYLLDEARKRNLKVSTA